MRLAVALGTGLPAVLALGPASRLTVAQGAGEVFLILAGVALLAGFFTPVAGILAAIGNLALCGSYFLAGAFADPKLQNVLYLSVLSLALALVGPGAFSLDARFFGRREIIIPAGRRPAGS